MITDKLVGIGKKITALLKKKKRAIAVGLIIVFTALVCALAVWGLFSVQHVRKIVIKGDSPYSTEELVLASGLEYGELLYSVDTDEIENNVLENAPYIREVKIRRAFFSRIVINVKSDTAKYCIKISENSKDRYILSDSLRVIDYKSTDDGLSGSGLVFLELPELRRCNMCQYVEYGEEGKNGYVKEMLDYFNGSSYADAITDIGLSSRFDDTYIVLYGKCKIIFGGINDIERKLELVRLTLEEHGLENLQIGYTKINASDPSNIVVSHPESLD